MLKITDADHFRRMLAGLGMILAPLALGAAEAIRFAVERPWEKTGAGQMDADAVRTWSASLAENLGLYQTMTVLNMLAGILFVPAVLGLMHLVRERGVVLCHLGGGLALIGLLGWAGHNVFAFVQGAALAAFVDERPDAAGMLAGFVERQEASIGFLVILCMFMIGFVIGFLLLAIGVYRSRTAPRWAAAALIIGVIVFAQAGSSAGLTAVAVGLLCVGFAGIGLKVLAMSDGDWARGRSAAVERLAVEGSTLGSVPVPRPKG
jgi:hypothetical protein